MTRLKKAALWRSPPLENGPHSVVKQNKGGGVILPVGEPFDGNATGCWVKALNAPSTASVGLA